MSIYDRENWILKLSYFLSFFLLFKNGGERWWGRSTEGCFEITNSGNSLELIHKHYGLP